MMLEVEVEIAFFFQHVSSLTGICQCIGYFVCHSPGAWFAFSQILFQINFLVLHLYIGWYNSISGLLKPITTKWVAINNRNLPSHSSGGQKSEVKVLTGLVPSVHSEGESMSSYIYLPYKVTNY